MRLRVYVFLDLGDQVFEGLSIGHGYTYLPV
jgi:hypothetical protein